jgi:hypothetical protein
MLEYQWNWPKLGQITERIISGWVCVSKMLRNRCVEVGIISEVGESGVRSSRTEAAQRPQKMSIARAQSRRTSRFAGTRTSES